jgi:transposase InsO family protein
MEPLPANVIRGMYSHMFNGEIKEFKALIENLSVRKIKILRSDNGGEYTSKEFVNICKDVGIKIPNKTV